MVRLCVVVTTLCGLPLGPDMPTARLTLLQVAGRCYEMPRLAWEVWTQPSVMVRRRH